MKHDIDLIQNYDVQGGPDYGRQNLPKLRAALAKARLDGFLVPHEDEYQNEYLPDCNERLMWVSGFTGSAGAAVVLKDHAAVFVDGRYTLQVRAQVDADLFEYKRLENNGVVNWLTEKLSAGQNIGYDPKLYAPDALARLRRAVEAKGAKLSPLTTNPIDAAWEDRPAAPLAPATIQPLELSGEAHSDKRARIGTLIQGKGAQAALITSPASIAWALNIRGGDVMCTPLPLSTLILHGDGKAELFIDARKLSSAIRQHLGNEVAIYNEDDLSARFAELKGKAVLADPTVSSAYHFEALEAAGAKPIRAQDPIALPKAEKNAAEIKGSIAAHKRDAVPLIRFLHWLDTEAQSGEIDEIQAATQLELFRHETGALKDLSFETISGAGSNGAIVHYRASKATSQKLAKGSLFLVDSGGQYQDGTTDVTRTVPIGKPSPEMRERFTLVLKGHIALALARFPAGTTGSNLDALARMPLWQQGLDYDHGTGHGVGVYLGVHEGPQRISRRPNNVALKPGMIVSNEPGYYKEGEYGIRIENLQYVTAPSKIETGEREMLGFETLTLAPIHRALIDIDLMTREELGYVNSYHKHVLSEIGFHLSADCLEWLKAACAEI